jgi:hypothetical protein
VELQQVGRFYTGVLWRDDLLPVPRYLELVVQAHMELDSRLGTDRFLRNLRQHTFLGDGTHLGAYLDAKKDRVTTGQEGEL